VKQKIWRSSSSSAWYQKQLGGWSGTPGTGGCPGGYLQGDGTSELETRKERGGEIVWEVERSGVSLRVLAGVLL
jgi:hypothetical protein